jgi:hypothetical protein
MEHTNVDKKYNKSELDVLSSKLQNKYIGVEPMLLIAAIALLIIYYYLFSSLGNNEDGSTSVIKTFFETMLWLLFIVLLLLNGISYIFGLDVIKTIKHMFGYETNSVADLNMDDEEGNELKLILKEQVFHLPEKKYTYDDAKATCSAYDSRLANYDEVNDALNNGADWCNYGWSDNQMALFPTQQDKWNTLQTLPGHEKDCGHPGVNGGYIDNTSLKFGVNCFGNKPSISDDASRRMREKSIYKKTDKEIKFDKQVDLLRNNLSKIEIAPFNHNNWSML